MATDPLPRLRKLCLALPEAREVEAWGAPTFRVKTIFAMYAAPGNHHGDGRAGVWVKAAPGNQELMVRAAPDRFFVPPYVGPSGWIGVYLDGPRTDWAELAALLHDAWKLSVPKKLLQRADARMGAEATASAAKKQRAKSTTAARKGASARKRPGAAARKRKD